jgi:hypothetical protein
MRRRVWCETLSYEELLAPAVVSLLVRYRLEVLLAVRPWHAAEVAEVCARLGGAGVYVALWPMLADAEGRWASAQSRAAFVGFVDQLLEAVPAAPEVVIDLEPAFADLERWKSWRPSWGASRSPSTGVGGVGPRGAGSPGRAAARDDYAAAREGYAAAVARWQRRPAGAVHGSTGGSVTALVASAALAASAGSAGSARRVTTAVMPMLAFDTAGQWMQRTLGTPADDLPVQRHSVMAYTSLFEGWSRGLVGRRRAEWMLGLCARRSRTRWGALAGLSLGAVGTGAFGDEPVLRSPVELARDVAIARAAGITELSLFELGGVVRRAPAEAWLEALCG